MVKTSKKKSSTRKKKGKRITKKTVKKGRTTKIKYESTKEIKVDKILVDNFVALQRVMVNLSSKFDNLSNQISKLLDLFEISAKSLAQKDIGTENENKDTQKIIEKIDNLSQHAGLIGKGLALIHESGSEAKFQENRVMQPPARHFQPPKQPMMPFRKPAPPGYQRSISSNNSKRNEHESTK